ncbi:MAG: tRNA (adenosine(37)-N6)-threonylcarbamoyltransferase complex ATPase subunit type 1 TsaE [Clostridia bacterium]|nr:tRNA (adenosine(37)-N6)-threonylcarbamoyltransferase complex ATPase subunit type 1 TsaE [Clostridia bacterium]
MTTVLAPTREDTQALGRALAAALRAGDVVLLTGDMGAGKSEFARGVARGLGITAAVPSPSFTILNVYDEGRLPLYHFDWYRIGDVSELTDMGLDEYVGGDGVCLIEWHERAPELLPEDCLEVRLCPREDGSRVIEVAPRGNWEETHR